MLTILVVLPVGTRECMDIKYAIIVTGMQQFTTLLPKIEDKMSNPYAMFIFSDEHTFIARYFNNRKYRKCTIYHIGMLPKHTIGNYKTVPEFSSYAEIYETLKHDADHIFS